MGTWGGKRHGAGRKRQFGPREERVSKKITTYVSEAEMELIEKIAKERNITISDAVRLLLEESLSEDEEE